MKAIETVTQQYTVRANRGRARIWIEGKRLASVGFMPGRHYILTRGDGQRLHLIPEHVTEGATGAEVRKVSGKGAKPIIDLSGAGAAPFNTGDPVTITYQAGIITIEAAQ